jgi:hypothetical protein
MRIVDTIGIAYAVAGARSEEQRERAPSPVARPEDVLNANRRPRARSARIPRREPRRRPAACNEMGAHWSADARPEMSARRRLAARQEMSARREVGVDTARDNVLRMTCAADQSRGRIAPAIRRCQVDTLVVARGPARLPETRPLPPSHACNDGTAQICVGDVNGIRLLQI